MVFASTTSYAVEPKTITSKVDAVTVYYDRALVTRSGNISLQTGMQSVVFGGLPAGVLDNTIRVSGESAGAAILDMQVENATTTPPPTDSVEQKRVKVLQDRIKVLQETLQDYTDRITIINKQTNYVDQIKVPTVAATNEDMKIMRPTIDDWQKFLGFMDNNGNRLFAELRKYERLSVDMRNRIDSLQRQISSPNRGVTKSIKNIIVDLDVARAGDVNLTISYVIQGASWQPLYDVRVMKAAKEVQLDYRASIRQTTGEDWNNVNITLSTARPEVGGIEPKLSAWYVNANEPPKIVEKSRRKDSEVSVASLSSSMGVRSHSVDAVRINGVQTQDDFYRPMTEPIASVVSDYYSVLFDIPSKSTVLADGRPHKVMISKLKFATEFDYSATPKLSSNVYLRATIKNTSELPLLPGTANIFSDRDFVSQVSMPLVSPTETFNTSLGVDQAIKIQRTRVNRTNETNGVFTKNRKVIYEYEYTLQNNRKNDASVEIHDQIPLSQSEKMIVELMKPQGEETEKDNYGMIAWKYIVKPTEKKVWTIKYSVEYPSEYLTSGIEP